MKKYTCSIPDCIFNTNNKKELNIHIKKNIHSFTINDNINKEQSENIQSNTQIDNTDNVSTDNISTDNVNTKINRCDCGKIYKKEITLLNHKKKCIIYKILINEIDISDPNSSHYLEELKKYKGPNYKKKSYKKNDKPNNECLNDIENDIENENDDNISENNEDEDIDYISYMKKYNNNLSNMNNKINKKNLNFNIKKYNSETIHIDNSDEDNNLVSEMVNTIIKSNPNIIINPYNLTVTEDDIEIEKVIVYKIDKDKFITELSKTISAHIYEHLSKIIDNHNDSIIQKYNKILNKYNLEKSSIDKYI